MERNESEIPDVTIGLDVGDRYSYFCVLDRAGEVVEEGRVTTTQTALQQRFKEISVARLVLEVGTHSPWLSRMLEDWGHEVIVANAGRVRLIHENNNKSDRADAESLARLGRVDPKLLAPIEHRGEQAQVDLGILRTRDCLVRARTQLVNHVRGAVKAVGGRLPKCSTHSFSTRVVDHIPEPLQAALHPMLDLITHLSQQIRDYDRRIETLARERYPETSLLRQVKGVGPVTALCFILTLEDPDRFPRSRSVGAFLGLRGRRDDSGTRQSQLGITKAGDDMLRRLLVQSAHYVLGPFGPDTDLRRWGLRLAERGGKNAKKRALVAVARKLAVLLHHLWTTGEVYEPLRLAHREEVA